MSTPLVRHRLPVVLSATLSLGLLATGCVTVQQPTGPVTPTRTKATSGGTSPTAIAARLDAGVQKAITYKSREDKVEVMTSAFSLSKNKGLLKAADSVKAMGTSLAGLQNLTTATSAPASRYRVGDGPSLRMIGAHGTYALAGLKELKQGDVVLVYDDQTREVTNIRGKDAELRFKFNDQGNKRAWSSEIVKSPDGTTGKLSLEVDGIGWKSVPMPQQTAPWICEPASPRPRSAPPTSPPPAWTPGPNDTPVPAETPTWTPGPNDTPAPAWTPMADADEVYEESYDDPDAGPSCGPDPNWVEPEPIPFRVAGNEYPEYVEALSFRFSIAPKGDENLAIEFAATLDEPSNVPNTTLRLPTHWNLLARVPGLTLNWDSRLKLIPNNSTFEGKGKMLVEVENGEEQFNYVVNFKEASRAASFSMTNVGAKMKLFIASDNGSTPVTRLISTENDSDLGTVEMKPGSSNVALVRFNDGKKMEWELFPNDLFSQLFSAPGSFTPTMTSTLVPEPTRAAPKRVVRKPVPAATPTPLERDI